MESAVRKEAKYQINIRQYYILSHSVLAKTKFSRLLYIRGVIKKDVRLHCLAGLQERSSSGARHTEAHLCSGPGSRVSH